MTDVREKLEGLGLGEYVDAFLNEGFDAWSVVEEITESDLNDLGVKLGHRRKLQRAIAETRQQSHGASPRLADRPDPTDGHVHLTASATATASGRDQQPMGRTKRKYKRHPKPDPNAPERPASAYVLFSNDMRELLKDRDLSFTEMAKIVGERWQVLPADDREGYETNAANTKEKYNSAMAEYKKTEDYVKYQQYLAEFRARQSHRQQHGSNSTSKRPSPTLDAAAYTGSFEVPKRAKLEHETSTETQSSLEDYMVHNRATGSSQPYMSIPSLTKQSHDHYSNSGSPSASQYSSVASPTRPGFSDGYAPPLASPTNAPPSSARHSQYEPTQYHAHAPQLGRMLSDPDSGGRRSTPLTHQSSTTSSGSIPPLSKDLSSRSSDSSRSPSTSTPFQSIMNDGVPPSSRVLPPINSGGLVTASPAIGKPLEHRPMASPATPYSPSDDPRHSSSLAALLRAGELASEADKRQQAYQSGSLPPPRPPPSGS